MTYADDLLRALDIALDPDRDPDDGGPAVPSGFIQFITDPSVANPLWPRRTASPPKRVTRRQRFNRWRSDLYWDLHDRLFPHCRDEW